MTLDRGATDPAGLQTPRTRLRRRPDRGAYDWDTIAAILDEGFICHLAFESDGQPYAIPTSYGRDGRTLYIHGSAGSRTMRVLAGGVPVCLTVTLIDGLILARSSFHNSVNYRSVVVLGTAHAVQSDEERLHGLEVITEHLVRGRWHDSRVPNEGELAGVTVLRLEVEEASAKLRPGGPKDEPEDMSLPVWAGRIPLSLTAGEPETDPESIEREPPAYARGYRRGRP
jgi:nitroimidazol reductase NimA-like FMN-containing flavoprotein (pyridoxamine 5'-phosphate oxidase superfamily)